MNLPEGVVFDLDGTLLETERLARECFQSACQDLNLPFKAQVYDQCVGTTHEATDRLLQAGYGAQLDLSAFSARWSEHYQRVVQNEPVPVKAGVVELVERLAARGIPLAIATSSRRVTVEQKLSFHPFAEKFEFFLCGDEVLRGKPDPWPYLHAAERLQLAPGTCWAIEDSDNGVRSAHAAGYFVVQIPDLLPPTPATVALGHKIVSTAIDLLAEFQ